MAEPPASEPEKLQDPERLWIWERHVYLDEHKRSWLPIILKVPTHLGGSRDVLCWGLGVMVAGDQGTEGPLCQKQEGKGGRRFGLAW
ncbi:T-cell leukemia/lymphoma protein 1A [Lemmus lemmus]